MPSLTYTPSPSRPSDMHDGTPHRIRSGGEHFELFAIRHVIRIVPFALGGVLGCLIVGGSLWFVQPRTAGYHEAGPIVAMCIVLCGLITNSQPWSNWIRKTSTWLLPGIAIGTAILIIQSHGPRTLIVAAWSPRVWIVYGSVIVVGLAFEYSSVPQYIYDACRASNIKPYVLIPTYIVVAGLLGNLLGGVSILAISILLFRKLLQPPWATRAAFALLFGGLLADLVTIGPEPTAVVFQSLLEGPLGNSAPSFWWTNLPICILAVLVPAMSLGYWMHGGTRLRPWRWQSTRHGRAAAAAWLPQGHNDVTQRRTYRRAVASPSPGHGLDRVGGSRQYSQDATHGRRSDQPNKRNGQPNRRNGEAPTIAVDSSTPWISVLALVLLAAGIAANGWLQATHPFPALNLFGGTKLLTILVLPASLVALYYIARQRKLHDAWRRMRGAFQILPWLAVFFSLIWLVNNDPNTGNTIFRVLHAWPSSVRFSGMAALSLLSPVADNIALAAVQASLVAHYTLPIWQVRLLFLLLCWAGGFTSFGCLQSLIANAQLQLPARAWLAEAWPWAILSAAGALIGLLAIALWEPAASSALLR